MPDFTIASARVRTSWSLTSHPNLFQVLKPIGGVGTSPAERGSFCANMTLPRNATEITSIQICCFMRKPQNLCFGCSTQQVYNLQPAKQRLSIQRGEDECFGGCSCACYLACLMRRLFLNYRILALKLRDQQRERYRDGKFQPNRPQTQFSSRRTKVKVKKELMLC